MRISGGIQKGLMIMLSLMTLIVSPEEIDKADIKPLKLNHTPKIPHKTSYEADLGDEIIQEKVLSMKAYLTQQRALNKPVPKATNLKKPTPKPADVSQEWIPMEMQATAYNDRGIMAGGRYVYSGAIAVDPRIIPLGSTVKIEGLGTFVAEDTGRLIKGHIIDIWMPSRNSCIQWGRRMIKVWIKRK